MDDNKAPQDDNGWLGPLYVEFRRYLISFILKNFPKLSYEDAEDIVQAVFMEFSSGRIRELNAKDLPLIIWFVEKRALDLIDSRNAIRRGGDQRIIPLDDYAELLAFARDELEARIRWEDTQSRVARVCEDLYDKLSEREKLVLSVMLRCWDDSSLENLVRALTPWEREQLLPEVEEHWPPEWIAHGLRKKISSHRSRIMSKLRGRGDDLFGPDGWRDAA